MRKGVGWCQLEWVGLLPWVPAAALMPLAPGRKLTACSIMVLEPVRKFVAPEMAVQQGQLLEVQADWAVHFVLVVWAVAVLLPLAAFVAPTIHREAARPDP